MRGEAWQTFEDRQLLDYTIAKGEGCLLEATPCVVREPDSGGSTKVTGGYWEQSCSANTTLTVALVDRSSKVSIDAE
jgi:hypothetical protein